MKSNRAVRLVLVAGRYVYVIGVREVADVPRRSVAYLTSQAGLGS
ncbi:hypothetical protein [Streptomyces sioyaensis]